MASTHIDYRKIDYDQLLDKPITRTSANVDTIKTAGVYDRGDGKRFLVSVDGNTITQIEESYNGYRTRTSTDGGLVRGTWTTAEFSDASAKRDVVVISGTEPVEKRETTAWIDTSDENKFKVYDGTDWMVISGQSIQTEEMPTASEELEGKIIQYEGATTSTFTHGYFYECVGDGQTPETYSWVNVPTQDSVEYTADEGIEIINGTRVDYSAMRGPCDAGFHVPTIEEMGAVFVDAGFTKEEVRNYLHVSLGVYSIEYNHTPASVSGGFYYCCNKNSSTRNVCYWTWNAMNPNIQGAKGTGRAYPIRAFKDVPSLPDATRTKTLTKGNIEVWDNPSIGLITVKINDTYYTLQDKNVGAVEVFSGTDFDLSEETGEDAKKQLGKLFQFGNNYGFYLTDLASHTTSNEKVDVSSYTPSTYQSSTFIITSTYTDNIYTGSYRDLWGGETGPQTITLHNAITNTGVLSINGKTGHVIIDTGSQAEVMPSPSAENVGTIIQYTGDTNQYYTHAHFYEVIEDPENPGTYIYKEVEVQDSPAQSEEMPEADEDNVGKIIQYMGDTTANFTHGYFYECVGDGQDPESFARERIDVQPAGAGDDHEVVTQAQYDALTPEQKAAKVYMIKGKGVAPTPGGGTAEDTSYDNTTSGLQADNVQDAIDEVNSKLIGSSGHTPGGDSSANQIWIQTNDSSDPTLDNKSLVADLSTVYSHNTPMSTTSGTTVTSTEGVSLRRQEGDTTIPSDTNELDGIENKVVELNMGTNIGINSVRSQVGIMYDVSDNDITTLSKGAIDWTTKTQISSVDITGLSHDVISFDINGNKYFITDASAYGYSSIQGYTKVYIWNINTNGEITFVKEIAVSNEYNKYYSGGSIGRFVYTQYYKNQHTDIKLFYINDSLEAEEIYTTSFESNSAERNLLRYEVNSGKYFLSTANNRTIVMFNPDGTESSSYNLPSGSYSSSLSVYFDTYILENNDNDNTLYGILDFTQSSAYAYFMALNLNNSNYYRSDVQKEQKDNRYTDNNISSIFNGTDYENTVLLKNPMYTGQTVTGNKITEFVLNNNVVCTIDKDMLPTGNKEIAERGYTTTQPVSFKIATTTDVTTGGFTGTTQKLKVETKNYRGKNQTKFVIGPTSASDSKGISISLNTQKSEISSLISFVKHTPIITITESGDYDIPANATLVKCIGVEARNLNKYEISIIPIADIIEGELFQSEHYGLILITYNSTTQKINFNIQSGSIVELY